MNEKPVYIYMESNISPFEKTGKAGFVMEYVTDSKLRPTLSKILDIHNMTAQQADIYVLTVALSHIVKPCKLIICPDKWWLEKGFSQRKDWEAAGYIDDKGNEIKDALAWQMLFALLDKHEVTILPDQNHEYRSWLKNEVKKTA